MNFVLLISNWKCCIAVSFYLFQGRYASIFLRLALQFIWNSADSIEFAIIKVPVPITHIQRTASNYVYRNESFQTEIYLCMQTDIINFCEKKILWIEMNWCFEVNYSAEHFHMNCDELWIFDLISQFVYRSMECWENHCVCFDWK